MKEQFYSKLDCILLAVTGYNHISLLGDFNARIGSDNESWRSALGREGVGWINDDGLIILSVCT